MVQFSGSTPKPFLKLVGAKEIPPLKNIMLGLQRVPGQETDRDKEGAEGLPDACFFDEESWAVVLEAKVQAGISVNQLMRHRKTSARYGYTQPHIVLLSIDKPNSLPNWANHIEWKNLYCWFSKHITDSLWAKHFVEYMQIFETKMISENYNIRGTLTMFDGFKFSDNEPYTYSEGKRLIRLVGDELRKNRRFVKSYGIDATEPGRKAITRGNDGAVWDYLPLKIIKGKPFTSSVHPSIGIRPQRIDIALTVPNAMRGVRKTLKDSGIEGFKHTLCQIEKNLRPVLRKVKSAKPMLYIHQRHYKSQRSNAETDGRVDVDLRTVLNPTNSMIKYQPGWLEFAFELLVNKKTNIQWGIEVICPHSEKIMQTSNAIDIMVDAWLAMKPLKSFVKC